MIIDFDPAKDAANREKHGISLAAAADMDLLDSTVVEDPRDYKGERRFNAYGRIGRRLYVLCFTPRGDVTRLIGLRKANPRERKRYDRSH